MEEQAPPRSREHDVPPAPGNEYGSWRPVQQPPIPGEYEPRPAHDAPPDQSGGDKKNDDVKA